MLLYLNDTQIIGSVSTEGKSQAMVFLSRANERGDEPHILLHRASSESCCFWLLSALLNKVRWAGRDRRVRSHHTNALTHTQTHNPQQCPGHQVYTCLQTYVYVGGEAAPSTVITVVHLSESEACVCVCVLHVRPLEGMLGMWSAFIRYRWSHCLGWTSFKEGHGGILGNWHF